MKQDPTTTTNGLTRRSFVKRSVVAAVAVSSMTIFSGLVDAAKTKIGDNYCEEPGGSACALTTGNKWECAVNCHDVDGSEYWGATATCKNRNGGITACT